MSYSHSTSHSTISSNLSVKYQNMSEQDFIDSMVQHIVDYPDPDRKNFLVTRPWFNKKHIEINNRLSTIVPDTHIVSTPFEHIDIDKILSEGKLIKAYTMIQEMELGRCHDNCEILYGKKYISNIYSGYALSDDGLWRFHSWGISANGDIVETTTPRILYYGITLY